MRTGCTRKSLTQVKLSMMAAAQLAPPGPLGRARRQSRKRLQHQPLEEYLALRDQFGDVVRLAGFPQPHYLVSHPDAVQHVLRDQAQQYRKGILFQSIAALQGQGLLTSEGELWRQQRRLAQPAFQPRQLIRLSHLLEEEAQLVVLGWRQAAKSGEPINVAAWMHRLTFRVVGRALLGIKPDSLDSVGLQLQTVAAPLKRHLAAGGLNRWAILRWISHWGVTPSQRQFQQAVAGYNALVQDIIDRRRLAMQQTAAEPDDLLARLISAHAQSTDGASTDQLLRDEVITIMGAGVETSANALSWAWYVLSHHPHVAERLHAELAQVLNGRPPTQADLVNLPYSRLILDETMRLYPPSSLLPRQANRDDYLEGPWGGYRIPRHTIVMMSQYVTHRHPDFWPDPKRFDPERFTPTQSAARHRFAYFPFGAGPRICMGQAFALMEMHLALATVAQTYSLRATSEPPVIPELAPTLRPRYGLWMTVHKH